MWMYEISYMNNYIKSGIQSVWREGGTLQYALIRSTLGQADHTLKQNHSTQDSRVVPHRGTNWAALWLTAQIGRDAVLSKSYGRGWKSVYWLHYILTKTSVTNTTLTSTFDFNLCDQPQSVHLTWPNYTGQHLTQLHLITVDLTTLNHTWLHSIIHDHTWLDYTLTTTDPTSLNLNILFLTSSLNHYSLLDSCPIVVISYVL